MRRKLKTILKYCSETKLSKLVGISQPRLNKVKNGPYDCWVYLDNGIPGCLTVEKNPAKSRVIIYRKSGTIIVDENGQVIT